MAITKETVVDKIEVLEIGTVQVRTATVIKEDGNELTRSLHRHVLHPSIKNTEDTWEDTDISGEDAKVQAICNAVWTDEVKTAFQEMRDGQNTLNISYHFAYKDVDRGLIEKIGPSGIVNGVRYTFNKINALQSGQIYHYLFLFFFFIILLVFISICFSNILMSFNVVLFLLFVILFV